MSVSLNLAAFPSGRDTIHVVIPSTKTEQYAPAVCALLDQIRQHTLVTNQRWPMLWALDEMAGIAPLPNLPAIIADAGSQRLLVLGCLQDLSQARHRWGDQADGLLTLFTTTLLLPGIADPVTLKTVSTLAGLSDRKHHSTTRSGLFNVQRTVSTRQEPLLPQSAIAHGKKDVALHLRSTNPTWMRLTPWHSTSWLNNFITAAARRTRP